MGRALQNAQVKRYKPKSNGRSRGGGMIMKEGVTSIGLDVQEDRTRSVLELHDLDDFLEQADLANRDFLSEREGLVVLDETGQAYRPSSVKWDDEKPNFVFTELSVPRRPAWDESTTPEDLQQNEHQSFLDWRRAIAVKEEELMRTGSSASVTPFEKNIEVWRQLWRVLERCSCLLQLVDARNPLFYLSADLKEYAESLGKPMMVLINKSDYLSAKQRAKWRDYLVEQGWDPVFFSAAMEQKKIDEAAQRERRKAEREELRLAGGDGEENGEDEDEDDEDEDDEQDDDDQKNDSRDEEEEQQKSVQTAPVSSDGQGVDAVLTREQLLETMKAFAQKHGCEPDPKTSRVQFGMVGFPNVGKSSGTYIVALNKLFHCFFYLLGVSFFPTVHPSAVINVLVGSSKHAHGVVRVGVAAQPGKTKHFQTLMLPDSDDMMLCDCPGLVFPSFVSNTADLIAAGVYPIAQMRDHWPVVNLICKRIPRQILNAMYGIHIPVPSHQDMKERGLNEVPPPTGEEFLTTLCHSRGMLAASSGNPDFTGAARLVIKDYAAGKLLYCHPPPSVDSAAGFMNETVKTSLANAAKLREKLEKQVHKADDVATTKEPVVAKHPAAVEDGTGVLDDEDLLDLLEETPGTDAADAQQKSKRKWGKKNRKNRNNDPYGCHSTPDESLLQAAEGTSYGVFMNSGKKHGKKSYTRPMGYGSQRRAVA